MGLTTVMFLILFTVIGSVGTFFILLYFIGDFARTAGMAHISGARLAIYPLADKFKAEKMDGVDGDGDWVYKDNDKKRKLKVKPNDVKITGSKCPTALFMPNNAISSRPAEAYVSENASGENEEFEVWGESLSMISIKKKIKNMIPPSLLAGVHSMGVEANKPLTMPKDSGIDKGTALKVGGLASIIVIIIVALFVVTKMGLI